MALPTLQPFYQTKRTSSEVGRLGLLVNRRAHEADVKQKWREHQQYFRNSDLRSSKQEAWTSSKSFHNSIDAYNSKSKAEEKKQCLHERREKLQQLLEQEKVSLERELMEISKGNLSVMRSRTEELKSRRECEEKKIAKEKLHDHWQTNCPELRQLKSRRMQLAAKDQWEKQIQLKQEEKDAIKRDEERCEVAMEEKRLAILRLEEDGHLKQQLIAKEHAKTLQEQIVAIKAKEKEAELLEQKQLMLYQEQLALDIAEKERNILEDKQRKLEFGRVLSRQHKAQLRRRSRQAQEALELDMKILEELSRKEEEEDVFLTNRKQRAKEDVKWMKEIVARQLDVEKQREAEFDVLYQEEAARMWRKQEAEWEKEKLAREKLMQEVLEERRDQIMENISEAKKKQALSIQQREELLKQIELNHHISTRDLQYKEHRRDKWADELQTQITARKDRMQLAQLQDEVALTKQRAFETEYEDLVELEKDKITSTTFQPKTHSRTKMAW